jgi:hypothetical protein
MTRLVLTLVALVLVAAPARAADPTAPGTPDRTFSDDGRLRAGFGATEVRPADIDVRPDDRLVVLANGPIARYTPAGRPDRSFSGDGVARIGRDPRGDGNDALTAIASTSDGGLIVVGRLRTDILRVVRLRPDGMVDTAFGRRGSVVANTGGYIAAASVLVLPGGDIVVAAHASSGFLAPGYVEQPRPEPRLIVLALDARGAPREGFGAAGRTELRLPDLFADQPSVHVQSGRAGGLVLATAVGRTPRPVVAGLLADGRPDPELGPDGVRELGAGFDEAGLGGITGDGQGRLVWSGRSRGRLALLRTSASGEVDPTFGTGGFARLSPRIAFAGAGGVASLGNRLAVGYTRASRRATLAMVGDGGRLDRGFARRGVVDLGAYGRRGPATADHVAFHRRRGVVVAGGVGDGLSGIRDDFGRDVVALARLRTAPARIAVPAAATVTARGTVRLRMRCRTMFRSPCRTTLRISGHGVRDRVTLALGRRTRTVRRRLGRRVAALVRARRRLRVSVEVRGFPGPDVAAALVRLRRA